MGIMAHGDEYECYDDDDNDDRDNEALKARLVVLMVRTNDPM